MKRIHSARVDLNLLEVFDAVAATGSTTLAAARLSLSQSAVSHALNRLRDLKQDPLFVRGSGRLIATPRAEAMVAPVRAILEASRQVFATSTFNPATTEQTFRISASDYAMMCIMPKLVRALKASAPSAVWDIHPAVGSLLAQLESGEIDASFWGAEPPPAPYRHEILFQERFIGLICIHHPLAAKARQGTLSLDDYLAYPHMMVSFRNPRQSPIDARLGEMGRVRKKGVITPNFTANISSLPGTDLIMSLPSRLVAQVDPQSLTTFDLPIDIPAYPYSLIWHSRTDTEPAFVWLRRLILEKAVEDDWQLSALIRIS